MPAGTITLTNNSTTVTGSGTAFPTELKANDFLVAVVGGTTYTLGVKSVESATALTLTTAYGGPTTSGLAWTPIPNGTLVGITAQIAADTARAIRGLNYDKNNWQQLYSASGNITVTLPDGSAFTGPSWLLLTQSLAGKVNTNDSRLGTLDGKLGGTVTGDVDLLGNMRITLHSYAEPNNVSAPGFTSGFGGSLTPHRSTFRHRVDSTWGSYSYIEVAAGPAVHFYRFTADGRFTVNGAVYNTNGDIGGSAWSASGTTNLQAYLTKTYATLSSRRLKENIEPITQEEAIAEVNTWKTYNYDFIYGKKGSGVIADETDERFISTLPYEFEGMSDIEVVDNVSMLMGYVPPVLQFLLCKVELLEKELEILKGKLR